MDKKCSVLVVDDEEYIREIIRIKLEASGFEVKEAANGEACLKIAREFKPNVILLDIAMPGGIDGIETLSGLKKDEATRNIKVFLFTGQGLNRPDLVEMAKRFAVEDGAVDFIRKEIDLDELVKKLLSAVKK